MLVIQILANLFKRAPSTPSPYQETESQAAATSIMGKNMLSVAEMIHHFNIQPTPHELAFLETVPFRKETLRACTRTHILLPVFPISAMQMFAAVRATPSRKIFARKLWHQYRTYAHMLFPGFSGWQLVRITPLPDSVSTCRESRKMLVAQDEEIASAQILLYTMIGFYMARDGIRLFHDKAMRCLSGSFPHVYSANRIVIGPFDRINGLCVGTEYTLPDTIPLGTATTKKKLM